MEVKAIYQKTLFKPTGEDNGYRIYLYRYISGDKPPNTVFSAAGYYLPDLSGCSCLLQGDWVTNQYGGQLNVRSSKQLISRTQNGIKAFLKSLDCISDRMINKLWDKYREDAIDLLEENPNQLLTISGMTQKKLKELSEAYASKKIYRDLMVYLSPYGIRQAAIKELFETFGTDSIHVAKKYPFRLLNIQGIGFDSCERIAIDLGIVKTDVERIKACVNHAIEKNYTIGSTGLSDRLILQRVLQIAKLSSDQADIPYQIIQQMCKHKELFYTNHLFFTKKCWLSEWEIAKRITELYISTFDEIPGLEEKIRLWEKDNGFILASQQREAVISSLNHGFSVITGGPGCGKTTITKAIIDIRIKYGKNKDVLLVAPTGRAAKQLSDATGMEASTIHSLLKINDITSFTMKDEKIEAGTIIVDEASMLDTWLAQALFKSIANGSQIVIIGDTDQLPSVGPGSVLRDVIKSGKLPVVKLTEVFRQNEKSLIVTNSRKIKRGLTDIVYNNHSFIGYNADSFEQSAKIMLWLYKKAITKFGQDEVCVLSPHHHETLSSVDMMNSFIQRSVNPREAHDILVYRKREYRLGDFVMHLKNKDGIANGDIGIITKIDQTNRKIEVMFDKNITLEYSGEEILRLELGYAMSIHKSQGSQYKCVIINILLEHGIMLNRNLLYTAITRAKKVCCIVSNPAAMNKAIKTEQTNKRLTALSSKIQKCFSLTRTDNPFFQDFTKEKVKVAHRN